MHRYQNVRPHAYSTYVLVSHRTLLLDRKAYARQRRQGPWALKTPLEEEALIVHTFTAKGPAAWGPSLGPGPSKSPGVIFAQRGAFTAPVALTFTDPLALASAGLSRHLVPLELKGFQLCEILVARGKEVRHH